MTEQILLEYALNAAWQVPLVTATAWLLVRAVRLGPLGEHRLWLAVLATCVLLPTRGITPERAAQPVVAMPSDSVPQPLTGALIGLQPSTSPQSDSTPAPPAPAWHTRVTRLHLSPRILRFGAWIYATVVMLALLRLTRGWLGAKRLLDSSETYAMNEAETLLWHAVGTSLNVRLPQVRLTDEIVSPVVVGIFTPVLLLPLEFSHSAEPDRRAALCHELAHIRRHDCLIHALCQVAALPLIWHPIVETVQRKIARTREMACDSIAARAMHSEIVYARCLLRLAQAMLDTAAPRPATQGMGLFQSNKLEERVMKLTESKKTLSARETWAHRAAGIAAMTTAIATISIFHLTPVKAQSGDANQVVDTKTFTTTQSVAAPQPPTPPAPAPAPERAPAPQAATPAPTPAPPAPLPEIPSAPLAPMAPLPQDRATHGEIIEDDSSISIAHGKNAHVMVKDGTHMHRWMGADGIPFEVINSQEADLTPAQQRQYEAEYQQKIAQAQRDIERAKAMIDSKEFKAQLESIKSGAIARQIAEAQKDIAEQTAKLNSPEFKAQMNRFTSGEIQKQIEQARKITDEQLATINSDEYRLRTKKQIDEALKQINSVEMKKALADAQLQTSKITSEAIQKSMAEAQKRLDEASKRFAEDAAAQDKAQQPAPQQ